jgi:hypothetical protein
LMLVKKSRAGLGSGLALPFCRLCKSTKKSKF